MYFFELFMILSWIMKMKPAPRMALANMAVWLGAKRPQNMRLTREAYMAVGGHDNQPLFELIGSA